MRQYTIRLFYSGFNTFDITAENENEAIEKARNMYLNKNELLSTLEPWSEADEVETTKND
ncbi:hypothetical protein HY768_03870 [candidate division TA06 bacterium]|uniref:Uncharacterized protein n=1 Tax=candidate division TA06 bacterium TaxID=2250710 RepID=A0A933ID98_UNCT6|nr:hypothetical protein [candidate division TA06 bacterium]